MANKFTTLDPTAKVGMSSIYRMSDAPPNWAQDDPTQPDYIANKEQAEKLRPIYVDGTLVLDDTHESGLLNLVSGENISLVVRDNNVIINATNTGGEGPAKDVVDYVQGDGVIIAEILSNVKSISIDNDYIKDELIAPLFTPVVESLLQQKEILSILVGEDVGKSIQEIATEVSKKEINIWFNDDFNGPLVLEQLDSLTQKVNIDEPISSYVDTKIDERVAEMGGTSAPATSENLGSVKIDDKTIKMNELKQIYVSKISTDELVQGEQTLVLNGGNENL